MSTDVLILTVGAGRENDIEGTLLTPLRKSILDGVWKEVLLVPSQATVRFVYPLMESVRNVRIRTRALPQPGVEDDIDACYDFFARVFTEEMAAAGGLDRICLDFTRGTKAMSAGAVLAAATLGMRRLRYITGDRVDGTVRPGTESIRTGIAARIGASLRLSAAWEAVKVGQFPAALAIFPEGCEIAEGYEKDVAALRGTASFYGAWDRFDYRGALTFADEPSGEWGPTEAARSHLERLSRPERINPEFLRHLAADILANAVRRLRWGQPEDALVRIYRASELIGQVRCARRELDTENMDASDESVKRWLQYKEKQGNPVPQVRGKYSFAKANVASYLKFTGDPLGKTLCNLDRLEGLRTRERNNSLLAHGFEAVTPGRDASAMSALKMVESIFVSEDAENVSMLAAAQFQWFEPENAQIRPPAGHPQPRQ